MGFAVRWQLRLRSLGVDSFLLFGSWQLFSENGTKDQMQLLRLLPQAASLGAETFLGSRNHSQEELGLFGFLATGADLVSKVLFRDSIVSFAVVRANTCPRANQLLDQTIIDRVLRYLLGEPDNG